MISPKEILLDIYFSFCNCIQAFSMSSISEDIKYKLLPISKHKRFSLFFELILKSIPEQLYKIDSEKIINFFYFYFYYIE